MLTWCSWRRGSGESHCPADAHDAHGGGVLEKAIGQLMLMMLMAAGQGSGESHWSADAHDAHGGGVLEKAIGQLMLMMLMAAGFWRKQLAS